jgi:hypothetical protein
VFVVVSNSLMETINKLTFRKTLRVLNALYLLASVAFVIKFVTLFFKQSNFGEQWIHWHC